MFSTRDFEVISYIRQRGIVVFEKGADRQIAADLGWDDTSTVTAIQSRLRKANVIERVEKDGKTRGGAYQLVSCFPVEQALLIRADALVCKHSGTIAPELFNKIIQVIGL